MFFSATLLDLAQISQNILMPTHHTRLEQFDWIIEDSDFIRQHEYFNFRLRGITYFNSDHKETILLLRNPYKAVISYWNHVKSRNAFGPGLEVEKLQNSIMVCSITILIYSYVHILNTLVI